jgi:succinoglycan biosynthesis protein ExoV
MKLLHYRGKVPNFGDDLNAFLWQSLAPDLIDNNPDHRFVGIGTIIGMDCGQAARLHVFSSGAGNDPIDQWRGRDVTYWCVRGPLSCQLLDLPEASAITDGAIVTPLAAGFPEKAAPTGATLIIPHFQTLDFPGWDEVARQTGFELLDPRADPREVVRKIASASLVLTESLHGAILADTYGIPWSVFATSANFGTSKFVDWCESVGLKFHLTYVPPPNPQQILEQGKGQAVWGKTVCPSFEDAAKAFHSRVGTPKNPGLRGKLKAQFRKHRALQALLPYAPARTAEALARLAKGAAHVSQQHVRQSLQDRMMTRLGEVSAFNRTLH